MQEPYQVSPLTVYEYVTPDLLDSDPLEGTMLASTRGHSAAVVARWSLRNSFTTNRIKLSKKKPPMVKQYTNSPQVLQSYGQFVATPEVTSERASPKATADLSTSLRSGRDDTLLGVFLWGGKAVLDLLSAIRK